MAADLDRAANQAWSGLRTTRAWIRSGAWHAHLVRALLGAILIVAASCGAGSSAPAADFPPFVMTFEAWSPQRMSFSDGRPPVAGTERYRLDYRAGGDWDLVLFADSVVPARNGTRTECRGDTSTTWDAEKRYSRVSTDPGTCRVVNRWIGHGLATGVPWAKTAGPARGQVTYRNGSERVVYDIVTGLPLLYEAGDPVGARQIYWLGPDRGLPDDPAPGRARVLCETVAAPAWTLDPPARVAAAYDTTRARFAAWELRNFGRRSNDGPTADPAEPMALCVLDGDLAQLKPLVGSPGPVDRFIVTVTVGGTPVMRDATARTRTLDAP